MGGGAREEREIGEAEEGKRIEQGRGGRSKKGEERMCRDGGGLALQVRGRV